MTIYYVNQICSETAPEEYRRNNSLSESTFETTPAIPVSDARSYIEATAPIPSGHTFVMSRMWEHSSVFALDFIDSQSANAVFGRMSHFVEVTNKTQIQPFDVNCYPGSCHKGEGYDLRLSDVADFYNFALKNGIELSDAENTLLEYSLENSLFKRESNGIVTPVTVAAVFATSRDYSPASRREIFTHEYSHALYFVDPSFRSIVHKQWQALKPEERRFLSGALIASGFYASGKDWLIETEAQAHGIADPVSDDGFVNVLGYAARNCTQPDIKGCSDFYSYEGDIRRALHTISYDFRRVSECYVPFVTGWEIKDWVLTGEPFPEKCSEAHDPPMEINNIVFEAKKEAVPSTGVIPRLKLEIDISSLMEYVSRDNFNVRQLDQIRNPRFSALLDGIQATFDRRHDKK